MGKPPTFWLASPTGARGAKAVAREGPEELRPARQWKPWNRGSLAAQMHAWHPHCHSMSWINKSSFGTRRSQSAGRERTSAKKTTYPPPPFPLPRWCRLSPISKDVVQASSAGAASSREGLESRGGPRLPPLRVCAMTPFSMAALPSSELVPFPSASPLGWAITPLVFVLLARGLCSPHLPPLSLFFAQPEQWRMEYYRVGCLPLRLAQGGNGACEHQLAHLFSLLLITARPPLQPISQPFLSSHPPSLWSSVPFLDPSASLSFRTRRLSPEAKSTAHQPGAPDLHQPPSPPDPNLARHVQEWR